MIDDDVYAIGEKYLLIACMGGNSIHYRQYKNDGLKSSNIIRKRTYSYADDLCWCTT